MIKLFCRLSLLLLPMKLFGSERSLLMLPPRPLDRQNADKALTDKRFEAIKTSLGEFLGEEPILASYDETASIKQRMAFIVVYQNLIKHLVENPAEDVKILLATAPNIIKTTLGSLQRFDEFAAKKYITSFETNELGRPDGAARSINIDEFLSQKLNQNITLSGQLERSLELSPEESSKAPQEPSSIGALGRPMSLHAMTRIQDNTEGDLDEVVGRNLSIQGAVRDPADSGALGDATVARIQNPDAWKTPDGRRFGSITPADNVQEPAITASTGSLSTYAASSSRPLPPPRTAWSEPGNSLALPLPPVGVRPVSSSQPIVPPGRAPGALRRAVGQVVDAANREFDAFADRFDLGDKRRYLKRLRAAGVAGANAAMAAGQGAGAGTVAISGRGQRSGYTPGPETLQRLDLTSDDRNLPSRPSATEVGSLSEPSWSGVTPASDIAGSSLKSMTGSTLSSSGSSGSFSVNPLPASAVTIPPGQAVSTGQNRARLEDAIAADQRRRQRLRAASTQPSSFVSLPGVPFASYDGPTFVLPLPPRAVMPPPDQSLRGRPLPPPSDQLRRSLPGSGVAPLPGQILDADSSPVSSRPGSARQRPQLSGGAGQGTSGGRRRQ